MKNFWQKMKSMINPQKKGYQTDDEEYRGDGEEAVVESDEILAKVENIRKTYVFWLYLIVFLVFCALFVKLYILQIIQGDYNKSLAEGNRIRTRNIIAARGIIYDRHKNVLAKNIPDFTLVIYPADIPKDEAERDELYIKISEISGLSVDEIKSKTEENLDKYLESVVLKQNIPHEEALIIEEKTSTIKGVALEKRSTRGYATGLGLAHILGYVGDINQEEYKSKSGYHFNDKIGKSGIEKYYEEELRGLDGKEQIEVDSSGRLQKIIAKIDPMAGDGLVLSIDSRLQEKARQYLAEDLQALGLKKGVVIISDPRNGEILSLVSLPDYDNNIFSSNLVKEVFPQLVADPNQPLFNRAVGGVYPSGSSIKPVVASAALQEHIVGVNDWIICKGELLVPNQYDPSIIYRYKDWTTHGGVNVIKALAESCNVFFYTVGGGFDRIEGLGVEKLVHYLKLFGLGDKTGIDIEEESKGLVPDPDWKQTTKKESWFLGDTYHLSIGQGDLGVTPLQVNNYTSAIANGGLLLRPHIGKETISAKDEKINPIKPQIIRDNFVDQNVLATVRAGMRACVTQGSCSKLAVLPVSSAGKTGTAQSSKADELEHAWFTAFAPYENPKVSITVLVENGGEGSVVAEPIALKILQYYFSR